MSEAKENKRYWLKLDRHFFDSENIVYLQAQEGGEKHVMVWIQLLLLCLKDTEDDAGFLRFSEQIPYTDELLARVMRKEIGTVVAAMEAFRTLNMVEVLSDGTLYIEKIQDMIGKESSSASRVRRHRARKEALHSNGAPLHSNGETVTSKRSSVTLSHNKEVEVEIELELETEQTLRPLEASRRERERTPAREEAEFGEASVCPAPELQPSEHEHQVRLYIPSGEAPAVRVSKEAREVILAFQKHTPTFSDTRGNVAAAERIIELCRARGDPVEVVPQAVQLYVRVVSGEWESLSNGDRRFWSKQPLTPKAMVQAWERFEALLRSRWQEAGEDSAGDAEMARAREEANADEF